MHRSKQRSIGADVVSYCLLVAFWLETQVGMENNWYECRGVQGGVDCQQAAVEQ